MLEIYDKKITITVYEDLKNNICPLHKTKLIKKEVKVIFQELSKDFIFSDYYCNCCKSFLLPYKSYTEKKYLESKKQVELLFSNSIKLQSTLSNRKIENIVHFTNIENLKSILDYGIIPRSELRNRNSFIYNDLHRYDNKLNCSCFSIEYPNLKLLNNYIRNLPDQIFVIVILNSSILLNRKCFFAEHNAASKCISTRLDKKCNAQNLESLFKDNLKIELSYKSTILNRNNISNIKPYLPTSDQAEVLIEGTIPIQYIKKVIFKDSQDMELFISKNNLSNNRIIDKFCINDKIFVTNRNNYEFKSR